MGKHDVTYENIKAREQMLMDKSIIRRGKWCSKPAIFLHVI